MREKSNSIRKIQQKAFTIHRLCIIRIFRVQLKKAFKVAERTFFRSQILLLWCKLFNNPVIGYSRYAVWIIDCVWRSETNHLPCIQEKLRGFFEKRTIRVLLIWNHFKRKHFIHSKRVPFNKNFFDIVVIVVQYKINIKKIPILINK